MDQLVVDLKVMEVIRMHLGVDYYPEHWDIEMIDEDLTRMLKMGVNTVRIGEFAWAMMEKSPGTFDFSFFDHVIKKCKEYGLQVMFGTPTATFPAWLAKREPSIFNRTKEGNRLAFGGRRQYCYNSDVYMNYSLRIVEKLVQHYQKEDQIFSWQIDNELGHEGSDDCYCENCLHAFQQYLAAKYASIDELNQQWGTIFWGQTYSEFAEIPLPTQTITEHNPSMRLDWARFRSHSLNQFAQKHIEMVRKQKGSHQTVTTNLPGGFFDKWFDHNEFSRDLDFVSYDNYPVWGGLKEPVSPAMLSMTLDFVRGLKGENFWIVEQLMGAQGHDVIGYLPRPNQAKLWSYHAFAHGTNNMLYFRWRGMTHGAEQNCLGIIDANNQETRKFNEVQAFFKDISAYETMVDSPIKADIAVLYDFDSVWSWRIQRESSQFNFTEEVVRLYEPFYKLNTPIDVIRADVDFSSYKVLLLPVMKVMDDELTQRIETFVKQGGTVVFSYRAGFKDRENNVRFGEKLPGPLAELLGIEIEEVESLHEGQTFSVVSNDNNTGTGKVWREMIRPVQATSLYKYTDTFYSNYSAVTVNKFGDGKAYYVGGGIEATLLNEIAEEIADSQKISKIASEKQVEVMPRVTEDGQYYFMVMNHSGEDATFRNTPLAPFECKIIQGDSKL